MTVNLESIRKNVEEVAHSFAAGRDERLRRLRLDPADFDALAQAGFLESAVPQHLGGHWRGVAGTVRAICGMVRVLARVDPSLALVSTMHSGVLYLWSEAAAEAPPPHTEAWRTQREEIFAQVKAGQWWGTIASEPGGGGDLMKTQATARPGGNGQYLFSGTKGFGSGSGVLSSMVTTAVPEGEELPDIFVVEYRNVPWDGSAGIEQVHEWDGIGMSATQSHGFKFEDFPATRYAWPGNALALAPQAIAFGACTFSAVILGVLDAALAEARRRLKPKAGAMRPYEQVEWSRAVSNVWLARQAHEGMLRAIESSGGMAGGGKNDSVMASATRGKAAIAELAESTLVGMSRVIGGGSISLSTPFGQWGQDVRALGFLRPPWDLMFDNLFDQSWDD